jgi:hypothetical protein
VSTEVSVLARVHDESYHGFVVTDRGLGLAPVRAVDSEGWDYPWHATVQLIKAVPEGFVIGGGVLIGPRAILTARHMGIDETWCYSRHPDSGAAWYAGEFTCGNFAGPAAVHPEEVDIAVAELVRPEPAPYATLRRTPAEVDELIYSARTSQLRTHALIDTTVIRVGSSNATCTSWPDGSTFITPPVVGPGDSGGPAFAGDDLIGIVHGGLCGTPGTPDRHVFIHVPGVVDWIDSVTAGL